MDAISTTMTIMTGLGKAIEITKNLRDVDLKLTAAESSNQIADLYNALSDIKMNVADLKDEIREKNEVIKSLESKLRLESEMIWKDPFYYKKNADGVKDGPFCQQCFDKDRLAIRLPAGNGPWLNCNTCKSSYDNPNGEKPTASFIRADDYDPY